MNRLLRSVLLFVFVVTPLCASANAATYTIYIENHARESLTVHMTPVECMIKVSGPQVILDKAERTFEVETDQSGDCAVLHRASKIGIVISGATRRLSGQCHKWPLQSWHCGGDDHGLKIVERTFQNGTAMLTIVQSY